MLGIGIIEGFNAHDAGKPAENVRRRKRACASHAVSHDNLYDRLLRNQSLLRQDRRDGCSQPMTRGSRKHVVRVPQHSIVERNDDRRDHRHLHALKRTVKINTRRRKIEGIDEPRLVFLRLPAAFAEHLSLNNVRGKEQHRVVAKPNARLGNDDATF